MKKEKMDEFDRSKAIIIFLTFLVIIQVFVGGLLFSFFFTSMDSVNKSIESSEIWTRVFSFILDNESLSFIGLSLALNIILLTVFFVLKTLKKFPSTITIIVLALNCFVCFGVRTAFHICDLHNIFFDFKSLNILPIISIIVSSVFVVYDYIDYYKGTYQEIQASTTLPTEEAVKETIYIMAKRARDLTIRIDCENCDDFNIDTNKIEDLSRYRTNEGYFNNDALEIAADNMIKKDKL